MTDDLTEDEFNLWTLASRALGAASDAFGSKPIAAHALIHRLRGGQLNAAARRVVKSEKLLPNERTLGYVLIPKDQWSYFGEETENFPFWKTNEVEIWTDRRTRRYQYYEIRFDPDGLKELAALAPAASQPTGQPAFTQAEFDKWMPVKQAIELVQTEQGKVVAARTLAKRLATDQIKARAEKLLTDGKPYHTTLVLTPLDVWKEFAAQQYVYEHSFWRSGDLEIEVPLPASYANRVVNYDLYGVRFEPPGIYKILGKAPQPVEAPPIASAPQPTKHPGGAPRKEFWDDLLIAMFERLWTENWLPKNKTEVENAMLDWAASHGKQLGPTSVKIPAGKLFKLTQR